MKSKHVGKRIISTVNVLVDIAVLFIAMLLLALAGYALWDSKQIYDAADNTNYSIYKPISANDGKSFHELQEINSDVFSWLHIYGTNIDYPVVQGPDNIKYMNNNAEGKYSLSGSIFLDVENSRDFSDFNSILYGHHMEKKKMFGEIGTFVERSVFDSHRYGNLYYDAKDHGVEFFAFVHTDAYDGKIFTSNISEKSRQEYLDRLLAKAINKREINVTTEDHIVLLSTCSSSSTNGRDILVGRITDEVFKDAFTETASNDGEIVSGATGIGDSTKEILKFLQLLFLIIVPLLLILILLDRNRKKHN